MIVIGDVHGEYKTLLDLLDKLPQTEKICFVGDLIDRGPDSKKVIDLIIKNKWSTVLGNHEQMAVYDVRLWSNNGAKETVNSFGSYDIMKESGILDWFDELPLFIEWHRSDNQIFLISHSFADYGDQTDPYYVLWERNAVYASLQNKDYERNDANFINVFGHTPADNVLKIFDKHYMIDTGCTYGNKLSAIDLETEKIYEAKYRE